eukprot:TRINITY_DN2528_c0_g2_i1.p1 TRINITY_DN2528_c0_g2~~TRINITY_DN2528_c0_g2_i1.p1  ORF type:complete len:236 (-),score=40.98 TRINITY_DN2528_c0_g2_i1:1026-1733(-)
MVSSMVPIFSLASQANWSLRSSLGYRRELTDARILAGAAFPRMPFANAKSVCARRGGFAEHSPCQHGRRSRLPRVAAGGESEESVSPAASPSVEAAGFRYTNILVPIVDRNPYLSGGTRQALATAASLATGLQSSITVLVIDANEREQIAEHEVRMKTISWHLQQGTGQAGGCEKFQVLERLGEGAHLPAAVVGEVADELAHDLVVLSMESVHGKHMDANLLAEFVPCQVLLLPL